MNILVVGFGSIGQRHMTNLLSLHPKNNYFVLKHSDNDDVIQNCNVINNETIYTFYDRVEFIRDMKGINLNHIDAAFICNNTSEHLDIAFQLLDKDIDMFIEKPIDSDLAKVVEFKNKLKVKDSIVMIGYQTKFNPVYLKVKEIFQSCKNDVNYMEIKWANYLPSYHLYEDYTKRYAGKKELGGGALLTLSHEINILNSFYKDCEIVSCVTQSSKNFSVDVEDYVFALLKCETIDVNFSIGYSQVYEERYIKFQTHNKYIIGDLISNKVTIYNANNTKEEFSFTIKRNDLFENQMNYFFNCIENRLQDLNTVDESLRDMELISEIKSFNKF